MAEWRGSCSARRRSAFKPQRPLADWTVARCWWAPDRDVAECPRTGRQGVGQEA